MRDRARDLRQSSGLAEQRVWARLRGGAVEGFKVRRQHDIGPWTVDFACVRLRLVIEIDGGVHDRDDVNLRDHHRQIAIEALGWTVVRFTNDVALGEPWRIDEAIRDQARLLRSANLYGLVTGVGKITPVGLTDIGRDVVAPSAPSARPKALFSAFRAVDDFRKVEEFYNGKKLPEDEFFENNLFREFGIPRERVKAFIETFTSNLNYLHAFKPDRSGPGPVIETEFRSSEPDLPGGEDSTVGRQFLDTCFVMMPFGQWMDSYYREIYVPAIREAGMEAVRADELFSTGSVIEQIWEQISRAKVLLADLTGKNANVFYELGLAHAANKPVVFTTGQLEDVPFDLRHLRVAVYDIRDPAWGEKLKTTLAVYLKAAKAEPAKSVPQPFRKQLALSDPD